MKKLLDVIYKVLIELESSPFQALSEVSGEVFHQLKSLLNTLDDLWVNQFLDFCFIINELVVVLRHVGENVSKDVQTPLNTMQRLLWEHFQSAMRDFCCVFSIVCT